MSKLLPDSALAQMKINVERIINSWEKRRLDKKDMTEADKNLIERDDARVLKTDLA